MDFGKSELVLDHPEEVFHLSAHAGFKLLDSFTDSVGFELGGPTAPTRPHSDVPVSLGGQSLLNASVVQIGKYIGLISVQKRLGSGDVLNIGRYTCKAVNEPRLSIHPNIGLHAKVPFIALFGLAHLRVSGA